MPNRLSKKKRKEYIHNNGGICPFCDQQTGIVGQQTSIGDGTATQDVFCEYCKNSWTDIYVLKDIYVAGDK